MPTLFNFQQDLLPNHSERSLKSLRIKQKIARKTFNIKPYAEAFAIDMTDSFRSAEWFSGLALNPPANLADSGGSDAHVLRKDVATAPVEMPADDGEFLGVTS